MSWGDLKTSTFFVTEIMSAIRSRRSTEDLKYHLKILANLMALTDDLQHQRLNIIFNFHEGKSLPPPEQDSLPSFKGVMIETSSLAGAVVSVNTSSPPGLFKFLDNLKNGYNFYVLKLLQFIGNEAVFVDSTHTLLNYLKDNLDSYKGWV